jgi:hypothetical protein
LRCRFFELEARISPYSDPAQILQKRHHGSVFVCLGKAAVAVSSAIERDPEYPVMLSFFAQASCIQFEGVVRTWEALLLPLPLPTLVASSPPA